MSKSAGMCFLVCCLAWPVARAGDGGTSGYVDVLLAPLEVASTRKGQAVPFVGLEGRVTVGKPPHGDRPRVHVYANLWADIDCGRYFDRVVHDLSGRLGKASRRQLGGSEGLKVYTAGWERKGGEVIARCLELESSRGGYRLSLNVHRWYE